MYKTHLTSSITDANRNRPHKPNEWTCSFSTLNVLPKSDVFFIVNEEASPDQSALVRHTLRVIHKNQHTHTHTHTLFTPYLQHDSLAVVVVSKIMFRGPLKIKAQQFYSAAMYMHDTNCLQLFYPLTIWLNTQTYALTSKFPQSLWRSIIHTVK